MRKQTIAWLVVLVFGLANGSRADQLEAARGLLSRVLPRHHAAFRIELIPKHEGRDVFEIETLKGKTVLRGSTGVAVASALNWYLEEYCHCDVSVCGARQILLPKPLPSVPQKIRIVTPFKYRYCFNYCCFSYSMAWWDWEQWERVIDWMALHGINMPLAVTGQEATWQTVYRDLGLTDDEIGRFFVGPAYLPFGWMGCIDGWGGPLPQRWIDRHRKLQQKTLARERELGMTPVLQGFTGHVPEALKVKFPDAEFQQLPSWCGFPGTTFVDPASPLFDQIGAAFIQEQTRQYGTDHLYASDTFIEMSPPSDDPQFLAQMGKAVYGAMATADPEATWVMQGWLFVNNPEFWKPPQAAALLGGVPDERMLVLDLFCEAQPAWGKTEAFYGKPWAWCIIQDFGNQVSLHGGLPQISEGLSSAAVSPERGKLAGAGFIMEGLGNNPVVYNLMSRMMWRPEPPDLEQWVRGYAGRRYGMRRPDAEEAWRILLRTVYQVPRQVGSIICRRPALSFSRRPTSGPPPYEPVKLACAAALLADCASDLGDVDTYRYDLVHIIRQVLANLAVSRHEEIVAAYDRKDRQALAAAGERFISLMREMDELLATREEFLLGRWLADAKRWAASPEEERLYEWNARNLITLWGPKDGPLYDYASKQWAGLIRGFYVPRWERFLTALDRSLAENSPFDAAAFEQNIRDWEAAWTRQTERYPDRAVGDSVAVAKRLLAAHLDEIMKPGTP